MFPEVSGSYRKTCEKARRMWISKKWPGANQAPPLAEPDLRKPDDPMSVAEEQPQQNDYRYRHAQQPEQNSSSHEVLLEFIRR
jgi:hypothetical protein